MITLQDEDKIYFSKTREYFREVLSNYYNGNYRSAIVMLYSIAICDLLLKLQELKEIYNDKNATTIPTKTSVTEIKKDTDKNRSQMSLLISRFL